MTHRETNITSTLLAGGIAGTAVDVTLFPLDTIKTRLQSEGGFRASGGFRGIYSGVAPAALASAPSAALFFCAYEGTKKLLREHIPTQYEPTVHMVAASFGEVASCFIRVPTELVKQRRQVQLYRSSFEVISAIIKSEGYRGLFRGYISTVSREIPFSFIQFPLWEYLKKYWSEKQGYYVLSWQASVCGAISGGVSAVITTPLDVAKTRIMLAHEENTLARGSIVTALQVVYKQRGLPGLFSGILPRTTWIAVGGAVFLGVYEEAQSLILPYTVQ